MTSAGRAPAYALGGLLLALWAQPSEAGAEAAAEPAAFEAEPNPPTEGSPPPEAFTPREERLLSPIDEDQPAYDFAVNLFGRPLRIGGIAETRASGQIDVPFKDRRVDDIAIFRQKLTIGYFYKISDDLLILLKGGPVYRSKWTFFESHPRQE